MVEIIKVLSFLLHLNGFKSLAYSIFTQSLMHWATPKAQNFKGEMIISDDKCSYCYLKSGHCISSISPGMLLDMVVFVHSTAVLATSLLFFIEYFPQGNRRDLA